MVSVKIGNVTLPNPIVIASGPLTDKFWKIKAAAEAGAGAVSLKMTFVKVPFQSEMRGYSRPGNVIMTPTNKRLNLEDGTALMRQVKEELDILMMANYSAGGAALDEWRKLTEAFLDAGTDMLEPNFCCPNLSNTAQLDYGGVSIAENPEVCHRLVELMRRMTDRPLVPKIGVADHALLGRTAQACVEAGADAIHVVGTPILGLPPLGDEGEPRIPWLRGVSPGSSNGSICKYSTFYTVAQLAQAVDKPIVASGGLDNWKDCVDAIMWGASSIGICSAVMWWGWGIVGDILAGLQDYVTSHNCNALADFRGKALSDFARPDELKLLDGHARIDEKACTGCGRCLKPGHCDAIEMWGEKARVDPAKCMRCGVCGALCPVGAIEYIEYEKK